MFPSIFWSMIDNDGSICGAIPSGLLTKSNSHGFSSMKNHITCRISLPGTATSTNSSYISFSYDILVNLTMNRQDSRIIMSRGLMESTTKTGMQIRSPQDSLLTDCVDDKQTVKNLCASQKWHKMDLFLTFTCNQSEHFGVKNVKNWIDGYLWEKTFLCFRIYLMRKKLK